MLPCWWWGVSGSLPWRGWFWSHSWASWACSSTMARLCEGLCSCTGAAGRGAGTCYTQSFQKGSLSERGSWKTPDQVVPPLAVAAQRRPRWSAPLWSQPVQIPPRGAGTEQNKIHSCGPAPPPLHLPLAPGCAVEPKGNPRRSAWVDPGSHAFGRGPPAGRLHATPALL